MKKLGMVVVGWLLAMGLAFAQVNINTASQDELDGGRFWTKEEILENMGKEVFTPNFENEYKKYFM